MSYKIILSKTNNEFLRTYNDFLQKNKEILQLYFLNLQPSDLLVDDNSIRGGVYHNNKLSILFLNAFLFNLQLHSFDNDIASFDALAKFIYENDYDFRGIQGNSKDVKEFINSYNFLKETNFRFMHTMDIMRLDKLNDIDVNKIEGHIRNANIEDYEIVKDYIRKMNLEAMGESIDDEILDFRTKLCINDKFFYLYCDINNNPTSMVKIHPTPPDCFRINMVFTDKLYRAKGYAKKMLYEVIKETQKHGEIYTLFVDQKNPVSNKLYRDLGFYVVEDNYDVRIMN